MKRIEPIEPIEPYRAARDSSADRAVDISPVTKELLVCESRLLTDAINKIDHDPLQLCDELYLTPEKIGWAVTEPRSEVKTPADS
jgi:hypothetical protein